MTMMTMMMMMTAMLLAAVLATTMPAHALFVSRGNGLPAAALRTVAFTDGVQLLPQARLPPCDAARVGELRFVNDSVHACTTSGAWRSLGCDGCSGGTDRPLSYASCADAASYGVPSGEVTLRFSGSLVNVHCDMQHEPSGGRPAALLYSFHAANGFGADEWALTYDVVVNTGKNSGTPGTQVNYLLPVSMWNDAIATGETTLVSALSGHVTLNNVVLDATDFYRLNFDATGVSNLDYHRGRALSGVGAASDHDDWTNPPHDCQQWDCSCSDYGSTFGWFGSCCGLCFTTGNNGQWHSGGGATPYKPSDWTYRETETLEWWAVST